MSLPQAVLTCRRSEQPRKNNRQQTQCENYFRPKEGEIIAHSSNGRNCWLTVSDSNKREKQDGRSPGFDSGEGEKNRSVQRGYDNGGEIGCQQLFWP